MIKYKDWELRDDFTVGEMIEMTDIEGNPRSKMAYILELLESKRESGPAINSDIFFKDLRKLQEEVGKSFLE